jgi:hypothetical protein
VVDDEGCYSHAHAGLEPSVVGWEWPEEVAAEEEIDVDSRADVVAGSAGDREDGCIGRGKQGSGSKENGKHCRMWNFLGFCATAATRQGVEGWTLGLRSPGPHTEGLYIRGGRGLVEGVAGTHRGRGFRGKDRHSRRMQTVDEFLVPAYYIS